MANGNALGNNYVVDSATLSAASNGHAKAAKLVEDFAAQRAHVCTHTWSDAKDTASIPAPLLAAKPSPLAASEQAWALVNAFSLQIQGLRFAPFSMLEPKILIIACASCAGFEIVTEDIVGTFSLSGICTTLNVPFFRLIDI
jgi:hypothetical protein